MIASASVVTHLEAEELKSLSTPIFIPVQYKDNTGKLNSTVVGKPAIYSQSCVSIGVEKATVNRSDSA